MEQSRVFVCGSPSNEVAPGNARPGNAGVPLRPGDGGAYASAFDQRTGLVARGCRDADGLRVQCERRTPGAQRVGCERSVYVWFDIPNWSSNSVQLGVQ